MEFYKTEFNKFDGAKNGGSITRQVTSGVLEDLIPKVTPYEAELGNTRFIKFFVKHFKEVEILGIDIMNNTTSLDDEMMLFIGGSEDEVENDLDKDNIRIYKDFLVDDYDESTKTLKANVDVSEFVKVDDLVTFYKDGRKFFSSFVKTVDEKTVELEEVKAGANIEGLKGCSTIYKNDSDTLIVWVKHTIKSYAKPMEFPPNRVDFNVWYA